MNCIVLSALVGRYIDWWHFVGNTFLRVG